MRRSIVASVAAAGLATAASAQDMATAEATFMSAEGEEVGTATFTQTPNGVLIEIDVTDLPEGEHGFHIHETGECDASDGFMSAGGHYAAGMEHGFKVEGGPHPGDMANVFVQDDGSLQTAAFNDRVSIEDGENPLMDDDGSAIMIHSGADDYESQPSGDAGDRIACGVIE